MTDTFGAAPPPAQAPPADLLEGLFAPPSAGALIEGLGKGAGTGPLGLTDPASSPVSPRDRLIFGGLMMSGKQPAGRAAHAQAKQLEPIATTKTVIAKRQLDDIQKAGLMARMDQYGKMSNDPADAEFDFKLFDRADLHGKLGSTMASARTLLARFMDGDPLDDVDWDELSLTVRQAGDALEHFDADLAIGSGKLESVEISEHDGQVYAAVSYPLGSRSEAPPSLTGAPGESLPPVVLEQGPSSGITAIVGPTDVTHIAPVSPETDRLMRQLYPGPLTRGGDPVWLQARPLPIKELKSVDVAALSAPRAVVETVPSGEYIGVEAGDHIVFDWDAEKRLPEWLRRAVDKPTMVSRSRPDRLARRVGADDIIDYQTASTLLNENAWAVLPADRAEDVATAGFVPIPLEDGDEPAVLVMGITPAEAGGLVYGAMTHAGIAGPDEYLDEPIGRTPWTLRARSGEQIEIQPPLEPGSTAPTRVSERADRWSYPIDELDADQIGRIADACEGEGAKNIVVYSRQSKVDGWQPAREHAFKAPGGVKLVRTADGKVGDSNSVPVFVRDASQLALGGVPVDPGAVDASAVVFEELPGGRVRLEVEEGQDLYAAARDFAVLAARFGAGNVEFVQGGKRIEMFPGS